MFRDGFGEAHHTPLTFASGHTVARAELNNVKAPLHGLRDEVNAPNSSDLRLRRA